MHGSKVPDAVDRHPKNVAISVVTAGTQSTMLAAVRIFTAGVRRAISIAVATHRYSPIRI